METEEHASDPELVAGQMMANNRVYGKWKGNLAVDTISWKDGSRFDISFELKWLRSMIRGWEKKREEFLSNE